LVYLAVGSWCVVARWRKLEPATDARSTRCVLDWVRYVVGMWSRKKLSRTTGNRAIGILVWKERIAMTRTHARLQVKHFDTPDETRPFEGKGKAEIVELAGRQIARGRFEPGWRWSTNVKPIAGTDSCQVSHYGFCLQGRMRITLDSGERAEIGPGDAVAIPPGHDAEVFGEETCVFVDFGEISEYAKRQ
jgi:uncharacterized cupin superfamily protein